MGKSNFDIDLLKNSWQRQNVAPKYDSRAIENMLNRKSRNYVKYILWINILEFLFVLAANAYYLYADHGTDSFIKLLEKLGVQKTAPLEMNYQHLYLGIEIISLAFTGVFMVLFYLNYRKIHVESNLKKLILQIIRFKKTVNLFILMNIVLIFVFAGSLAVFTIQIINDQNIELAPSTMTGIYVGIAFAIMFCAGLIWLYYRIVYGIIMRRLTSNLDQLKEIENNEAES